MPTVVHRDAEALVADYLRPLLTGRVLTIVPDPRTDDLTVLRRLGGTNPNLVTDRAMLSVECWASDQGEAMDRAQLARGHLHDLVGQVLDGSPVYRVDEIAGPAALPDPLSQHPRVTFTLEVWLRGET